MERLDKILSHLNYGTRKEVKKLIKDKEVYVNGELVTNSDMKIDVDNDIIQVFNEEIKYEKFVYIMLNKPDGVISATYDPRFETVLDLMPEYQKMGVFPVGRLDIDTEGLLIISNDGQLAHNVLSPNKHVDKKYYVKFSGEFKSEYIKKVEDGILIDDFVTKPGKLEQISTEEAYITIHEGKFHQVKKMFEALNMHVEYLKRVEFGGIKLDETLRLGEYRPLTSEEIEVLKNAKTREN